ncbi:hypothetical protein [Longibacter sp.]|jgi:hypothetical protein|uniref:hypothetical protein n=1 Tax=Longibacter sp. TaxID=2045415 RepID=UPI003EBB01C4
MSGQQVAKIIYFVLAALSLFILGSRIMASDTDIFRLLLPAAILGFCTWRLLTMDE